VKKHLTSIGNSFGIIIDKPILDLLNIDKNTPLEVKTDGNGLIIRPLYDEAPSDDPADEPTAPPPPAPPAEDLSLDADDGVVPPPAPPPSGMAPPPPPPGPPSAEASVVDDPPGPPAVTEEPPDMTAEVPSHQASAGAGGAMIVVMLRDEEVLRQPLGDEPVYIGREKGCDIHLDDRALSRRHAKLERRGASIWAEDLGSANGTYVNGEEIKVATRLDGGDIIGLGHYRVHLDGVEEASSDTPVLTLDGPEGVHRFALVGEEVVIGRAQSCDISIGHKSISRRHLKIQISGREFVAEDLGSQNGIKLHGKRIKGPTPFAAGDALEICDFSITLGFLSDEEAEGDDDTNVKSEKKPRKSRTMLIDKSALVNAAYVDGDFENAKVGGKERGTSSSARIDTGEFDVDGNSGANKKGKVVRGKRR
jgi:pSer/pThr/pTyr-binding forkhead associated (FHA) protein/antitoxin component of MazEF toxin-antitoxin module